MGRYKYLLKNIGLLTLSNFATKLLSFFLVPLYTNILTTTEYGTYDLFATTVGVLVPILTLNIQESVMRFALDKNYNREALVTVSIRYIIFSSAIVATGLFVNAIVGFNEIGKDYAVFFFLMYFVQVLSGVVLAYSRGIDKISELSVSSVLASAVTIGCNILFLVIFDWRLTGYFLANIIGPLVQCIYLIACSRMTRDTHLFNGYQTEKKEMLAYCKPMVANSIAWWVNNASDRYIVVFFCGLAENGIYSVASKIPSILNVLQSIFNQAWTLSVVKDFDPEDKSGFFANTYKAYNCMLVVGCSAIIATDKILAEFLYAKDFYSAWKYVPWLTIAIIFGALSGYLGGFFSAVKNSKIFAKSSVIGAITNIILNIALTPFIGALGAAIATAVSYFEVWIFRYLHSRRYVKIKVNLFRDLITYFFLICQSIILLIEMKNSNMYILEFGIFILIVLLYFEDIILLLNKGRNSIKMKKGESKI